MNGWRRNKMKTYNYKRCEHEWYPRIDTAPIQCPKCKSQYWNIDKVKLEVNENVSKDAQFAIPG